MENRLRDLGLVSFGVLVGSTMTLYTLLRVVHEREQTERMLDHLARVFGPEGERRPSP